MKNTQITRYSGQLKTLLLISLGLTMLFSVSAQQTSVNGPDSSFIYDLQGDLQVRWDSSYSEASLDKSVITIESGSSVYQKNTTTSSLNISSSDLSGLPSSGTWKLTVVDEWSDGSESSDSVSFESDESEMLLSIGSPDEGSSYDRTESLEVIWESTNGFTEEHEIIESDLSIEDESGNTFDRNVDRNVLLYEDNSVSEDTNSDSETLSIDPSDLNNLNDGDWTINVVDYWGMATVNYQDSRTISVSSSDGDFSNQVITNLDSPSENYTHSPGDLEVKWQSENDYSSEQQLEELELRVVDSESNVFSKNIQIGSSVSSGASYSSENTVNAEELASLEPGKWTIYTETFWEDDSDSDSVEINAEGIEGEINTQITNPSEGSTYTKGSNFKAEYSLENGFNQDKNLVGAKLTLQDELGRTVSNQRQIEQSISANNNYEGTISISESSIDNLATGTWTVNLEAEWSEGFYTDSLDITVVAPSDDTEETDKSDGENQDQEQKQEETDSGETSSKDEETSSNEESNNSQDTDSSKDEKERTDSGDENENNQEETSSSSISSEDPGKMQQTLNILKNNVFYIISTLVILASYVLWRRSNYHLDI